MPCLEFLEWQSFNQISPIDDTAYNVRHGILCQLLAAVNGNKSKLIDWIPEFGIEQTEQEQSTYFSLLAQQNK